MKDSTWWKITIGLVACTAGIWIGVVAEKVTDAHRDPNKRPCEVRLKASAADALETYMLLGECRLELDSYKAQRNDN